MNFLIGMTYLFFIIKKIWVMSSFGCVIWLEKLAAMADQRLGQAVGGGAAGVNGAHRAFRSTSFYFFKTVADCSYFFAFYLIILLFALTVHGPPQPGSSA